MRVGIRGFNVLSICQYPCALKRRRHVLGVRRMDEDTVSWPEQDAVRLLMLLHVAADSSMASPAPEDAVACIAGEMRMQAMDFWLRNPDYLAWELLDEV